jgi:hypothetical protein
MNKIIKLTNTRFDLKGTPLYFNTDHITCFYDMQTESGEKTYLYGGNPAQTWETEETSKQIYNMISQLENDNG